MLIRQSLRYSTDLIFTFEYTEITKECRCRIGDIIKVQYNLNGIPTTVVGTIVETTVTKLDTTRGYMKLSKLKGESNNAVIRVIPFRDIINIDIIQSVFGTIINYIEDENKSNIDNKPKEQDKNEPPLTIDDEDGIKSPNNKLENNKSEESQPPSILQESSKDIDKDNSVKENTESTEQSVPNNVTDINKSEESNKYKIQENTSLVIV